MLWNWSIPWQEWNCLWETRNCPWIPCMIPLSFVIWNMIWFHKHSGHQPKPVTDIIWNQSLYPIRHYFPDIRANHRPGCWKQLPLPVPHCWQYRRRLESIATVRIMIADPSLEVCFPRHLSRTVKRSAADQAASWRQNSRDAPAVAPWVAARSVVCSRWFGYSVAKVHRGKRAFLSLYTIKMQVSLILLMRKSKIAKCTNVAVVFTHFCQLVSAFFIKNQPYTVVYDWRIIISGSLSWIPTVMLPVIMVSLTSIFRQQPYTVS